MKENLLHFIWKLKLFSINQLRTTNGQHITIRSNGIQNFNSGPDFSNAIIEIGTQLWAGNVEIHINSSDWYRHNHEKDTRYDSVILHVVWQHDVSVFRGLNETMATLELKNYIAPELLESYRELFLAKKDWINCEKEISKVDKFVIDHWLERLYFDRLEQKSKQMQDWLGTTKNNWEAMLFIAIAKNFGLKVNGEAFESIANSFDYTILRKLAGDRLGMESLLFGQSGLLDSHSESEYFQQLKKEYHYLRVKYKLKPISSNQVQFFRLRPNNFPTIRLSQLAGLYFKHQSLFSKLIEINDIQGYYDLFEVSTSDFWINHYSFEKASKPRLKKLSKSFIDLLVINSLIPVKFCYLKSIGRDDFGDLIEILEHIKPEKNRIITRFKDLGVEGRNAFRTQALLELKNEYCNPQKCLQCAIGKELLQASY
jgi:hypothetical protein